MAIQANAGTAPESPNELDVAEDTRPRRQWSPIVVCPAVFVILAMAVFGLFGSWGPNQMSGVGVPDSLVQIWWLAWAAYAVPHGLDVFSGSWLNYPFGQNFGGQAGSLLFLGVVLSPITKLFGPIVAWNVAVRLALAASAMSMFFVLRRWCTWPAAFVGGLLYGFSPYVLWNVRGPVYLFLIFIPLPPIIFLVLHEILVRQRWRPITAGLVLAVLCTLQFFVSPEILGSTVLIGALATILIVAANRHLVRERWRYAAVASGWAVLGGVVLLGGPLLYTLKGPEHINGPPFDPGVLSKIPADLLSPVVPNGQWIDPNLVSLATSHSLENSLALGGSLYLGAPLVIALVCFAVFFHKRRAILFAGSMALICFVLSLGSPLWVDNHRTSLPLPFAVIPHLPLLQGMLAQRLSLFTSLFAAGMFALGLDEMWLRLRASHFGRPSPSRTHLLGGVGVAILVVIIVLVSLPAKTIGTSATGSPQVPSFFSSQAVDTVPAGSVALTYPYVDVETTGLVSGFFPAQSALLDQAVSGMRFKLIGGYGWFPAPSGHFGSTGPAVLEPQSVQALFDVAFMGGTAAERAELARRPVPADLRRFLRKYHVATVIVDPLGDWQRVAGRVSAALGSPTRVGGVVLWSHVQERLASGSAGCRAQAGC